MRSIYRETIVVTSIMTLLMNPVLLAWGNPPPGRWEKVAQTKPGDKISVYPKNGDKHNCFYQAIDDQSLICLDSDDNEIQFELSEVDKIILPRTGKYSTYGALIGAAAGVGISVKIESSRPGKFGGDLTPSGEALLIFVAPAALGALGGFLTGGFIGSVGETIYISKELAMKKARK